MDEVAYSLSNSFELLVCVGHLEIAVLPLMFSREKNSLLVFEDIVCSDLLFFVVFDICKVYQF